MSTLEERIDAAASDMSIEHDGNNSPGETLKLFLDEHDLEVVDGSSDRAAESRVVCAALLLSEKAHYALLQYGDCTSQPFTEAVTALREKKTPPVDDEFPDSDLEPATVTMLRQMVAAPTYWRSKARALLARIDATGSPSPAAPASES